MLRNILLKTKSTSVKSLVSRFKDVSRFCHGSVGIFRESQVFRTTEKVMRRPVKGVVVLVLMVMVVTMVKRGEIREASERSSVSFDTILGSTPRTTCPGVSTLSREAGSSSSVVVVVVVVVQYQLTKSTRNVEAGAPMWPTKWKYDVCLLPAAPLDSSKSTVAALEFLSKYQPV
uniref:Uncharacterized protein n=1 Tax=Vespula pensylvanica TaxID=30213 RepID=A0A834NIQ0_VESPE|nr:hypothetical protein H0235_013489 [Vespula pensylvanica]